MVFISKDYALEELFELNERKYSRFHRKSIKDFADFVLQQGSTPSGKCHFNPSATDFKR